ncbi:hypothetical protein KY290_008624 [Solanum tuberosum]|uniref:Uncharacterized protein n=1 Tax=Solanum tuberosum TaxID=4113 RepID=A0ABQ7W913_SOLTU|nr:hypothetical protein KY290_008624 [Solanum tuberosum]
MIKTSAALIDRTSRILKFHPNYVHYSTLSDTSELAKVKEVYTARDEFKDECRLYDYMDSQPDINVRVGARKFSGRLNYLKKNESYITAHSCEIKRNFLDLSSIFLAV